MMIDPIAARLRALRLLRAATIADGAADPARALAVVAAVDPRIKFLENWPALTCTAPTGADA